MSTARLENRGAAMESMGWHSLVHSLLMVRDHDYLSAFYAVSSLWDYMAIMAIAVLALVTLDRRYSMALSMTLIATAVCEAMKRVIREPRPVPPWPHVERLGHGMPSLHSCTGFAIAAALISEVFRVQRPLRWRRAVIALLLAATQAYGRWYNRYHTIEQVLAGTVVGLLLSAAMLGGPGRKIAVRLRQLLDAIFELAHSWL